MILSNQIICNKCGDSPYSSHVHDFKYCKCGSIAVDGGMDYLKRTGTLNDYKDISIVIDDDVVEKCTNAISHSITGRGNSLGVLCAVMRTLRDCGYNLDKEGE